MPKNAIVAFRATGIFPYNDLIFSDDKFMAASVTDIMHDVTSEPRGNCLPSKISQLDILPSTSFHRDKTPDRDNNELPTPIG